MSDLAFKASFAATLFAIMQQSLGLVSLGVKGHDEALACLFGKLGFELVEDRFVP
jgi:hypothetical protein